MKCFPKFQEKTRILKATELFAAILDNYKHNSVRVFAVLSLMHDNGPVLAPFRFD